MNSSKSVLIFDGICNLCDGLFRFVVKRDRNNNFLFATLQSKRGRDLLRKYQRPSDNLETLVLIEKDKCFVRSTAFIRILKTMGGIWRLFYLLIFVPRPLRDWVYDFIAERRYDIFGMKSECMVPTKKLKDRFLK